jgi:DNA polymerase-1
VESLYGRRIIADSFTKATNFPVQATEKDIVAFAISFIHDRLQREKVDGILVNCVHDEIICEAAEQDAPKVLQIMQEEMIRAGQLILKTVQVKAEGHIANYWDEAK